MSEATLARALIDRTGSHPVVSVLFDLNPDEFATAPARATQVSSLLDAAGRSADELDGLDHDAKRTLQDDLARVRAYLESDDLPVTDARAVAVYASGADDLFETVSLPVPAGPVATVASHPLIEPLVAAPAAPAWCAVLAALDRADVYLGRGDRITGHQHDADYVRGHGQQADTGHGREQDAEDHLIGVARALHLDWRRARFSVLALGGPVDAVTRLEKALDADLRGVLLDERLSIDPSAAGDPEVAAAVGELVDGRSAQRRAQLLSELTDGLQEARGSDRPARAVAGPEAVREALTERRVATLLLGSTFMGDEREAAIRDAVAQDAGVVAYDDETEELSPARPVAAMLRF